MGKKRGPKPLLNISSAEDVKLSKMSKKERGKSIGSDPDDWDKNNIQQFIDMFEAYKPGLLRRMRQDVEVQMALSNIDKYATISKDSDMRRAFWLPDELSAVLEIGYPSFWTNPKHARWFIRHFPHFSFEDARRRVKR